MDGFNPYGGGYQGFGGYQGDGGYPESGDNIGGQGYPGGRRARLTADQVDMIRDYLGGGIDRKRVDWKEHSSRY